MLLTVHCGSKLIQDGTYSSKTRLFISMINYNDTVCRVCVDLKPPLFDFQTIFGRGNRRHTYDQRHGADKSPVTRIIVQRQFLF